MKRLPTKLSGLVLLQLELAGAGVEEPDYFDDRRGGYCPFWDKHRLQTHGVPAEFVWEQTAYAYSQTGVIRGIHAEPWDKLIFVITGWIQAALVDLRPDSPTFGEYELCHLDSHHVLFVPSGFGNSYQALRHCHYMYMVNGRWSPTDKYLMVNCLDPDLAIPWSITSQTITTEGGENYPIMSDKDKAHPTMRQIFPNWKPK